MIRLYVLDFDKTLIPYDSWGRYLRELFMVVPLRVGFVFLLRKTRIISRAELKRWITVFVSNSNRLYELSKTFIQRVAKDIQLPSCIFEDKDEKIVLIISASPMCYLQYLSDFLDIECIVVGSDYINGKYVEMHGKQKLTYLEAHFPHDQYKYEYALSDSVSDLVWMREFGNYELKTMEK